MRVLQNVWNHKRYALLLFLLELGIFFLFLGTGRFLLVHLQGESFFSFHFHLLPFLGKMFEYEGMSVFFIWSLAILLFFFLIRIFLLSGMFALYTGEADRRMYWNACGKYFIRFIALFLLYFIPALLLLLVLDPLLGNLFSGIVDTRFIVAASILKQLILFVFLVSVSYFHSRSRAATVRKRSFSLSFHISAKSWLAYTGYYFMSLLGLSLFVLSAFLLLTGSGGTSGFMAILLWQAGIAFHLFFRLAAFSRISLE